MDFPGRPVHQILAKLPELTAERHVVLVIFNLDDHAADHVLVHGLDELGLSAGQSLHHAFEPASV
jgi:hypothetical protein